MDDNGNAAPICATKGDGDVEVGEQDKSGRKIRQRTISPLAGKTQAGKCDCYDNDE